MTKETLFRAIGEAAAEQIEESRPKPRRSRPWRRYAAAAACLVLILSAALALPRLWGGDAAVHRDQGEDTGHSTDSSTDGNHTSPGSPGYSRNIEIGEVLCDGGGLPDIQQFGEAGCFAAMTAEEFLQQGMDIFRGTVEDISYYEISIDGTILYTSVARVAVSGWIRGQGAASVSLLLPGWPGQASSTDGLLAELTVGSEAIFLPTTATADTGVTRGESYFCYADLAGYYFPEGIRTLFLATDEGLAFDPDTWAGLSSGATLDDAAAYLRSMTEETPPEGLSALTAVLEGQGYQVEATALEPGGFLQGERRQLTLTGDTEEIFLTVYCYPSAAEAEADAAAVSPNGYSTRYEYPDGTGTVTGAEWVDTPHFYRLGNLIVLYVGREAAALTTLEAVCGPSFAGGR